MQHQQAALEDAVRLASTATEHSEHPLLLLLLLSIHLVIVGIDSQLCQLVCQRQRVSIALRQHA
jgi:hypothetical protein